ncbi:uncharacterized protein LOC134725030 [Mytilus trossulus]|uniref:uncharacterized protein LOC134725030 n=1 Tax=Mytilus trossulus TaxID=6551 RepID=UPI003007AC58
MADNMNLVVEGLVKFRDGKKWKPRWCVLKKPSPVADRLQVQLYKDIKDATKGNPPKQEFYVEGFYGLETVKFDKEPNVLCVVCQKQVTLFAFENREQVIQFEIKIRKALGEEDQFVVDIKKVPNNSKLQPDRVRLLIHGQKFCFTASIPPKVLCSWQITDLRRFGGVDGKFVFEGGSRCTKGAGLHCVSSKQAEEIAEIVTLASQGKTASCRKANKRRSQCCDSFDSGSRAFSDSFHKDFHSSFNDSQHRFMHDNRWPKRTSFYSDHSLHLRSIENLERERLMSLYDVPPNRIRKVEGFKCTKKHSFSSVENKSLEEDNSPSSFGSGNTVISRKEEPVQSNCMPLDKNSEQNVSSLSIISCNSALSLAENCLAENFDENQMYLGCNTKVSASAPALCGYGAYISDPRSNLTGSVPNRIDEEIDKMADYTRRQDAWDRLQGEEVNLQRELSLLDEILEGCKVESRKKQQEIKRRERNRPPPLPCRSTKPTKRPTNINLNPRNVLEYNDSCLSPNLASKLNKIPPCSKLSAPLPYVNLEKYDIGDIDKSHVYVPAGIPPKDIGNWSAPCFRSGSFDNMNNKLANKENRNSISRRSSNSSDCLQNLHNTEDFKMPLRENIYANEIPLENKDNVPPKLPPKGPKLKRQNPEDIPPPLPTRRRISDAQYQNSLDFPPKQEPTELIREENYLMMGNFAKEPNAGKLQEELDCELMVKLPTRKSKPKRDPPKPPQDNNSGDPSSCYIDMAGQFLPEPKKEPAYQNLDTKPPLYFRSNSTSAIADRKVFPPNFNNSFSGTTEVSTKGLVREENYLLMSAFKTPPKCSSESSISSQNTEDMRNELILAKESSDSLSSSESSEAKGQNTERKSSIIPFPNLINFQKHNVIKSAKTQEKQTPQRTSSEKLHSEGGKSPGFLSRLIRRNSGNRKSMSQSQENLLASSSSESCLERVHNTRSQNKDAISISSGSSPSNSRRASQQDISIIERRRSSSFPNRSSFLDMLPQGSSEEKRAHHESQESFVSTVSMDDQMQLIVSEEMPCSLEVDGCSNGSEKSKQYYMGPCQNNEEEKKRPEIRKKVSDFPSPKTSLKFNKNNVNNVYTVRHVRRTTYEYEKPENTSKTDDEKLIELLTRDKNKIGSDDCDSLKLSVDCKQEQDGSPVKLQKQSPAEEAAAIARLVTSLPPFIPPKMKTNPCSLSPVLESAPYTPSSRSTLPSNLTDTWRSSQSFKSFHSESMSNRRLPSHSEITSAMLKIVDNNQGKDLSVWVKKSSDSGKTESVEEQEEKFKAIVIEVDETQHEDDTMSLSSQESSLDDGTRSSPASTILRPRSGKEYKMIERIYTGTDSFTTSPVPTPTSPSGTSVFTFDNFSASPSTQSIYSHDKESLATSKGSRHDDNPPKVPDRVSPYRAYVNITPPASPLKNSITTLQSESERQLIYAEIDLTLPTKTSRKTRKPSMKSQRSLGNNVEYALIDMEATQAIQSAGREHARTREDSSSLRRVDRKASLSSFRDRKASASSPSPTFRERKYSSSSSDSGHGE